MTNAISAVFQFRASWQSPSLTVVRLTGRTKLKAAVIPSIYRVFDKPVKISINCLFNRIYR